MRHVLTTIIVLVFLAVGCSDDVVDVSTATMTGTWDLRSESSSGGIINLLQNGTSLQGTYYDIVVRGSCTREGIVNLGLVIEQPNQQNGGVSHIRKTFDGTVNYERTLFVGTCRDILLETQDTLSVGQFTATKRYNE